MKHRILAMALVTLGAATIFVGCVTAVVGLMAMGSGGPKDLVIVIGLVLVVAGIALVIVVVRRTRDRSLPAPTRPGT